MRGSGSGDIICSELGVISMSDHTEPFDVRRQGGDEATSRMRRVKTKLGCDDRLVDAGTNSNVNPKHCPPRSCSSLDSIRSFFVSCG